MKHPDRDGVNWFTSQDFESFGLERRMVQAWIIRGHIPLPRPGTGATRLFSFRDMVNLALVHRLMGLGFSCELAAGTVYRGGAKKTAEIEEMLS